MNTPIMQLHLEISLLRIIAEGQLNSLYTIIKREDRERVEGKPPELQKLVNTIIYIYCIFPYIAHEGSGPSARL